MRRNNIDLPPMVGAVCEALWFAPRNAGISPELEQSVSDSNRKGFTESAVVGSYKVTLACSPLSQRLRDLQATLMVEDATPGIPPRNDGFNLLVLHYDSKVWRLYVEPSETLLAWNEVYQRLTGGVLIQESAVRIRHPEALIAASAVGQFLAEIVRAA